jgi:hypothetical protein
MIRNTIPDFYRTRDEIEQIAIMERLHLYNKGHSSRTTYLLAPTVDKPDSYFPHEIIRGWNCKSESAEDFLLTAGLLITLRHPVTENSRRPMSQRSLFHFFR